MIFAGRAAELGRLRGALDRRDATVIRVTGIRGGGKSALVDRALRDFDHVKIRCPPLPDSALRAQFLGAVTRERSARGWSPHVEEPDPDWRDIVPGVLALARAGSRPFVLALDDVNRLAEARSRFLAPMLELVRAARTESRPLHVILVGPRNALPEEDSAPNDDVLADAMPPAISVGPLHFRAALPLLPGTRPRDLLQAYGVFGGIPRVLAALDPDVALGTNVRRLVLNELGPLADAGAQWLERDVQTPTRYFGLLAGLARGEADWSTIHEGLPDLTRSGQLAPYLRRLEELGLVDARRSLDASPNSRSRRYSIADPFLVTWVRFVLLPRLSVDAPDYASVVRPALDDHLSRVFPMICRQHMAHDAIETLGTNAREGGSLWGLGYDIPVAGILRSGGAYYGRCHWSPATDTDRPFDSLDGEIRETRYGFGRQARIRVVFTGHEAPIHVQREAAKRHDAEIIDAAALAGDR